MYLNWVMKRVSISSLTIWIYTGIKDDKTLEQWKSMEMFKRPKSLTTDGEVRLALHVGGQLVHAQRHLPLEGRGLLTERREAPERALARDSLHRCMASRDGVRIGFLRGQCGHGQRRGGWRAIGSSEGDHRVRHADRGAVQHTLRVCWQMKG